MTPTDLGFQHRYVPAAEAGPSTRTLLLLHGTGGDENDLLALGRQLDPTANLLSPRGKVSENGMARFFVRFPDGRFDEADLIRRTHELADFVTAAAQAYDFDPARVVAVGYSNGANIAASMLLLRPVTLAGAVLLHAQVPLVPDHTPDLHDRSVLVSAGSADPFVAPAETRRLTQLLEQAGATVTLQWWPGGHALVSAAIAAAQAWLQQQV